MEELSWTRIWKKEMRFWHRPLSKDWNPGTWPVTMQQIMDIADSGKIMPPKATWFEPKLRSGLIIHKLD